MLTRLQRFCDGVIEAAWLAAAILMPVYFNIYSSRSFEPDKISLLRSLALVILAAWMIKVIDFGGAIRPKNLSWRESLRSFLKVPLALPIFCLVMVYLIATLFSIVPVQSILGSYQRLQGSYTLLSYLVIFVALVINLKKRIQVERLLTTIIIASLPVALYGILQHYQLDPIPWRTDTTSRITANMGNAIFIAAYLIMVFPITLIRIINSIREILSDDQLGLTVVKPAIYVCIASLQVIALYMSGSRGPALGWMASIFFVILVLAIRKAQRWLIFSVLGLSFLAVLFLALFNMAGGPFEALRASPVVGRFGLLLNSESGSGLVRRYIWEDAAKLSAPHAPLVFPDGGTDRFNIIRPLVGYGPESMFVAYTPFYNPKLALAELRNATPDRSHNETWDSMVVTGLLGVITYFWLFSSLFYYGLKWLGFIQLPGQKRIFFIIYIFGGILGGIVFWMWQGFAFIGIGIPFGLLGGLFAYLGVLALQTTMSKKVVAFRVDTGRNNYRFFILVGLMAAIIAHFIEINFGISIGVTRAYFWIYTALILIIAYAASEERFFEIIPNAEKTFGKPQIGKAKLRPQDWFQEGLIGGGVVGLILATLGFDFITNQQDIQSSLAILWHYISALNSRAGSFGILVLIITTWLAGSGLFAFMSLQIKTDRQNLKIFSWLACFGLILGVSFLMAFAYWLWHGQGLAVIGRNLPDSIADFFKQIPLYTSITAYFYFFVFFWLIIAGIFLSLDSIRNLPWLSWRGALSGGILVFLVFGLADISNLRPIQADVLFRLAEDFNSSGTYPVAIELYKTATRLAPFEDYYYLNLGKAFLDQARLVQDPGQQRQFFEQSEASLITARGINPLNPDYTSNLARLYNLWAAFSLDEGQRLALLGQSDNNFAKAIQLNPTNVRLWNEWAYLAIQFMNDLEKGLSRLNQALRIDETYDWTYTQLGDVARLQAENITDPTTKDERLYQAVSYYQKSLVLPGEDQIKYNTNLSLGGVYAQLGQLSLAITAYENALQVYPNSPSAWRVQEALAEWFMQSGDRESAIRYASAALSQAPQTELERLKSLLNSIK